MATTDSGSTIRKTVWKYWTTSYTMNIGGTTYTDTSTTAIQDSAWNAWCNSGTSSTTHTDNQEYVWVTWTDEYYEEVEKTKEEERAAKAQEEIDRIWRDLQIKQLEEDKKQAEDTAVVLLGELVSPVELEHYKKYGEIVVKGRKCDYVVRKGKGVVKIEKDKVTSLCIHLKELSKYPETDNTIAVKLLIEGDEKEFNKIANHSSMCGGDTSYWRKRVEDISKKYTERKAA